MNAFMIAFMGALPVRSDTIRLISARLATKKERTPYES